MNTHNLSKFSKVATLAQISNKLHELSLSDQEDLPRISQYGELYHNPPSSAKCPRCGDIGSLIEDGRVRALYECRSCGIFAKIKPKPKRLNGLRQSIAQGRLTTALEILEVAGLEGTDAIDALNLYRGVGHA